jgi:1-acyl-sn-glycerol-3-phosphate acyltransferases
MVTRIRFLVRSSLALFWFVAVSLREALFALRHTGSADVSHRYASALGAGFRRILHLDYEIANGERLTASQPCVYLANHRSNLDVVTFASVYPPKTIVIGKRAVLKIPLFGTIFQRGGNIAIDRSDQSDSLAGLAAAADAIRQKGVSVLIFPEGTRNHGEMLSFKKGGFHMARSAGVPLVPIVCAVPREWISGRRFFLRKRTEVKVEVLEPIDPFRFEALDELVAYVEQTMREALARLEASLAPA